ncbi:MAG: hydroxyethylthiazole kinase [Actinobacteria bacterium]|nr:MAG: hydroxyethylthiazole kinase [Actinomycetota bacterium]
MLEQVSRDLSLIREKKPLVHHLTNFVVMNETANMTLAIGALPIMSHAPEEVEEMVQVASCLVLNIGTLTPYWINSMILAGKKANELGIPVVLDPVGAGATKLRIDSAKKILEEVNISTVRGNSAEIAVLAGIQAEIKGVEAISKSASSEQIAQDFALKSGCVAAVTGVEDVVSDGETTITIKNGHKMMATITGTGCMSTTMVAAFNAVQKNPLVAALGGLCAFGVAGEKAAYYTNNKPGSFHVALYDEVSNLSAADILDRAKIEVTQKELA